MSHDSSDDEDSDNDNDDGNNGDEGEESPQEIWQPLKDNPGKTVGILLDSETQ